MSDHITPINPPPDSPKAFTWSLPSAAPADSSSLILWRFPSLMHATHDADLLRGSRQCSQWRVRPAGGFPVDQTYRAGWTGGRMVRWCPDCRLRALTWKIRVVRKRQRRATT